MKDFIPQLCHKKGKKKGKKKGEQLSDSMIRNVHTTMGAVWYDACEENGWDISNPFQYLSRPNNRRVIPARNHEAPQVFSFDEWGRFREAIEPHYLPIIDMMVMTGMIASEIAALRPDVNVTFP